jgi:hypothetical protein
MLGKGKSKKTSADAGGVAQRDAEWLNQVFEAGWVFQLLRERVERAADAHRALGEHYLGKLVLIPG